MTTTQDTPIKLKRIDVLNDYVAILYDIDTDLEIDKEHISKYTNEGIIVGMGPEAAADETIRLGDRVIFRSNKYTTLQPEAGGYGGRTIAMVKKADLFINKGTQNKYSIVFTPEE